MASPYSRTVFFNPIYDEAYALLVEARDYAATHRDGHRGHASPYGRMFTCLESMRITARLIQVMAWLMTQKAVLAGELSRKDAAIDENRLSGHAICLHDGRFSDHEIPPGMTGLPARSQDLFRRVSRLDELVGGTVP